MATRNSQAVLDAFKSNGSLYSKAKRAYMTAGDIDGAVDILVLETEGFDNMFGLRFDRTALRHVVKVLNDLE